ncbi:MAG: hypothetical protein CL609_23815 [Anaerolineaceae bacterium]|nr:hypothetical protein [Anaerolineaceae bacterium]
MANNGAPLTITLYDPETDEIKAEYSRAFVPWEILKSAMRLIPKIDPENMTPDVVDELSALVAEAFGNKFSAQEACRGCDVEEMTAALMSIVSRAKKFMPEGSQNPTRPGKTRRR